MGQKYSSYKGDKTTINFDKNELEVSKLLLEFLEVTDKLNKEIALKYDWRMSDQVPIYSVGYSSGNFSTNNILLVHFSIEDMNFIIYNSIEDDRIYYEENDNYEDLEKYLKRKVKEILNSEAFNKIKKLYK